MPRRAFTLIELLVTIAIVAVLIAILIPALGHARRRAGVIACEANLRGISQATIAYRSSHADRWPLDWDTMDMGMPIPWCPLDRERTPYIASLNVAREVEARNDWSAISLAWDAAEYHGVRLAGYADAKVRPWSVNNGGGIGGAGGGGSGE